MKIPERGRRTQNVPVQLNRHGHLTAQEYSDIGWHHAQEENHYANTPLGQQPFLRRFSATSIAELGWMPAMIDIWMPAMSEYFQPQVLKSMSMKDHKGTAFHLTASLISSKYHLARTNCTQRHEE